jgi:hypothetical protein
MRVREIRENEKMHNNKQNEETSFCSLDAVGYFFHKK